MESWGHMAIQIQAMRPKDHRYTNERGMPFEQMQDSTTSSTLPRISSAQLRPIQPAAFWIKKPKPVEEPLSLVVQGTKPDLEQNTRTLAHLRKLTS